MTRKPLPPPPDITITREDVFALPHNGGPVPDEGRVWTLARGPRDELRWIERWSPEGWRYLTEREATAAERVFLWRNALASDAALADMVTDAEIDQLRASGDLPGPVADSVRLAELRGELARLERRAAQA